ncbi:MAG: magnesium transporter [Weeksellaceae bacterium]
MNNKLLSKVQHLIDKEEYGQIKHFLLKHDFHEIADVIDHLENSQQRLFTLLPPEIQAEVVLRLNENSKQEILPGLSMYVIARFLHFNDEDDATDILQYLDAEKRTKILERLKNDKRKKIEKLLTFDKETAGGLMDLDFIIVKDTYTMKEIAEKVQTHIANTQRVPFVALTDEKGKAIGYIPHRNLILNRPRSSARQLAIELPIIKHHVDQEKLVEHMKDMKSEAIGVVDDDETILGIVHVKDIIRIAQAEATEDIYSFAGVEKEEAPTDGVFTKVQRRYQWLIINLATAFLAASVVGLFENTIERLSLLAVYMPIVAGEGGNAATQALAVVVRGLAIEEIPWSQAKKIIMKEAFAGMINGVIVGSIAALTAYIFHAPIMLGVVLGISMVVNLFIAGFFGALVPFTLKALKIDPAVASSIFVTTATDIIGFFVFLGLATILLL